VVDAVKQRVAQIERDVTVVAGENNPELQPGSLLWRCVNSAHVGNIDELK
jgi:hypothetical protein